MRKNIYLIAAISLLLAGCSTTRKVATAHVASVETAEAQRIEQTEQGTTHTAERQTDTDIVVTTTIDDYDTTQPADPTTGTPPLKRRETTTTQTQAKETATARATTIERQSITAEEKVASQTDSKQEAAEEKTPALSGGWGWFKTGFFAAVVLAIVLFVFKNKIRNFFKPF